MNHSKEELREAITAGCIVESFSQTVPFLSRTSKNHESFPKAPLAGTSYQGTAQWDWKMMKVQHESSSEPQVVTRALWDCSTTHYQLHARKHIPGTFCICPPCLQLKRELALTLMKTHCFDMPVRVHCFALPFAASNQARPVCNLKAPVKKLTFH